MYISFYLIGKQGNDDSVMQSCTGPICHFFLGRVSQNTKRRVQLLQKASFTLFTCCTGKDPLLRKNKAPAPASPTIQVHLQPCAALTYVWTVSQASLMAALNS